MPRALRTLGLTVAASLGLHGGLALLAATAMTVLPAWPTGAGRSTGRRLTVARAYKAGDKYLVSSRVQHDSPAPSPVAGTMLIVLAGLWEIQDVTPLAGQPRKYTFTVSGSDVIFGDKAGAMFRQGAVIAGAVDSSGAETWTVDGAAAPKPMISLFRAALPMLATRDTDILADSFQPPQKEVAAGETWACNESAVAAKLAGDGFHLTSAVTGGVTVSGPVDWNDEFPGRQIQITLNARADAMPGLPKGSELKSATFKSEGGIFLPDDTSMPVLHEKWVTDATVDCKLPGTDQFAPVSAVTTVERDLSFYVPDNTEPQEIEVTFVPHEELPVITSKLPKPAAPAEPEPAPKPQPKGPIHIVAKEDMPSVVPFESDTPFISDRNMRASATNAAVAGADPRIGSQEGEELPGLSLFNARANPAGVSTPPPPPPPAPPTPPQPAVAETPPAPAPAPAPEPVKEDRPPEKATVVTSDPNAPAPAPEPKPAEVPAMRDRPPDPVALSETTKPRPKPPIRPVDPVRPATKPGAKPVVSSVKSKVEGGLAVRGEDSSVDAKDTPEGRFYSAMHESIGLIWNTRLATVHGLTGSGVVEVEFDIDINGRVSNVKLVDPGKANPVLEDVCLSSVIKAKIPQLPASLKREIQDPLSGGKLHQKINFYKIPRR